MSNPSDWRVLVVEDEPDGQEVVVGMLRHFNVVADIVGTAEEALMRLAEQQYTAAIIDIALPHMDGLMLLKTIRSDPGTMALPCMAYTAYHSSLVKKQALEAGCSVYLTKPLDGSYFFNELDRIIQSNQL